MMKLVDAAFIFGHLFSFFFLLTGLNERSKSQRKGVAEEAVPEARCPNGIKQQPIRSNGDNNICQMKHLSGWPDKCPASPYQEISPLVANRSGAT